MCTPWTLSKLLRCKPCFSQHNCPRGDESETLQSAVVSDAGKRSVIGRKVSTQTEFGKDGVCDHSMLSEDGMTNKNKRYELRLRRGFEDERYIMFCFGEGESVDWNDDNDELKVFDDSGNDAERLNAVSQDKQEDGEEESSEGNSQTEWTPEDNSDSGTGSIRSRNSDISGGSSSRSRKISFSFPVLHEEWIGSPAQIPKPEDLSSMKNQGTHVRFQCYNF